MELEFLCGSRPSCPRRLAAMHTYRPQPFGVQSRLDVGSSPSRGSLCAGSETYLFREQFLSRQRTEGSCLYSQTSVCKRQNSKADSVHLRDEARIETCLHPNPHLVGRVHSFASRAISAYDGARSAVGAIFRVCVFGCFISGCAGGCARRRGGAAAAKAGVTRALMSLL
eukprot:3372477-Pleurochrysis_carterae.AAC.1